ncbi:MAG: peptidoglycan editing factor PgeF [Bacteroidetes bacterium]|nr:peptidoglycan editing factor PgeF [Bacteroidota bacterium]
MQKINILRPTIFLPSLISSGVTLANFQLGKYGFSAYKTDVFTDEEVNKNKSILANNIGVSAENLVFQQQIHTTNIQIIRNANHPILESDGMLTNVKNIVLCINLADCGGILCYDTKNNVIGAFHSGWQGTKLNIVRVGIDKMQEIYSTHPSDLLIYITPCAGREHYEVDFDVAKHFPNNLKQLANNKYLLDLKSVIIEQLLDVGVAREKIEISSVCTISNNMYHSFRRDSDKSGRMTAFIMMK